MDLRVKRVYEKASASDGRRILVDRLWPRGLSKEKAKIDLWLKEVAPSDGLRKRFCHDPAKWDDFKARYFEELKAKPEASEPILRAAAEGTVTLLFAAADETRNNALALKDYLESRPKKRPK